MRGSGNADGVSRLPSWAERERLAAFRVSGTEDVYVDPADAPDEFWNSLLGCTDSFVLRMAESSQWASWAAKMNLNLGLAQVSGPPIAYFQYAALLTGGHWHDSSVGAGVRLSAVEFLLDTVGGSDQFNNFVNERARFFHVGVRLEGNRFVPTTSEGLHVEIVQPVLRLLADPRFEGVDALYRKAFDRALANDAAGAVTAATSAVEEALRVFVPEMRDQTLGPLAEKARSEGFITNPVEEFIKKLYGLRPESDAHAAGTADFDVAMLALHLAGSLILYVGRSL